MATKEGRGRSSRFVPLLAVAVFAVMAVGTAVALANRAPLGLAGADERGDSAIGLAAVSAVDRQAPSGVHAGTVARGDAPRLATSRRVGDRRVRWWKLQSAVVAPATAATAPSSGVATLAADSAAPQTTLIGKPATITVSGSAYFSFSASESGSTFTCKLDSGAWVACTSPKAYRGLAAGEHRFSVRARDVAGNVDATPATYAWKVQPSGPPPPDTTAPNTSISSKPASPTTSTSASFAFSSSESGSNFACKLDSGAWAACTSPRVYSGLSAGAHRFSVRAADPSGNVDASPATIDWTIQGAVPPPDTVPPNTSIVGKPPATTSSDSAKFSFNASESGSTFECKLDAGPWEACTPPQAYDSVPAGEHEFLVRATDKADNVDRTPASAEWTVELGPPPPAPGCSVTANNPAATQSALASASPGAVICLAAGTHGRLALDASKSAPGVTIRAASPGRTTIAGASLSGSNLTLARFVSSSSISVQPGARGMTIEHNRVTGGGQGIDAGPTSTTTIDDTRIIGNQLIGPFGEDAIHLNRYHDANGDGVGVLIEGNEITNVRENGNHSDCLQTVWVGDHIVFRKNYLHDNRCQGFFVKDQASLGGVSGPINGITVENNLFVRNKEPCGPPLTSCGQPMYFQVFGPYTGFSMRRNTIWGDGVDSIAAFREGTGADSVIANNVIYRLWTDTNMSAADLLNNTICQRETSAGGSWAATRPGETSACSLSFANAAADDYRVAGSDRGVDWAPADQYYGP